MKRPITPDILADFLIEKMGFITMPAEKVTLAYYFRGRRLLEIWGYPAKGEYRIITRGSRLDWQRAVEHINAEFPGFLNRAHEAAAGYVFWRREKVL